MSTEQSRQQLGAKKQYMFAFLGLVLAAGLLLLLALGQGAMEISPARVAGIVWGKISGNPEQLAAFRANEIAVVWNIRLPRILCSFFVGAGLAVAGVVFQSLLRNPLADPYTLGVSTGAAFGASVAIYLNISYALLLPTSVFAVLFAFLTLAAVIAIAQKSGGMYSSGLVISGIIASSFLSAGISIIKMLAGENVSAIVFWLMGSFSARSWRDVLLVAPVVIVCSVLTWVFANDLDIMTLGDAAASALGIHTANTRLLYLVLASAITACCVSVSGVIGFVGLIVPHLLRIYIGGSNRTLLPFSALLGGILLLLADTATRLLSSSEIPVGALTTLLGGPFFIYVFLRGAKGGGGNG
jgi:ABC-type Fe3+-siderophore transport system, permease component